MGSLGSTLFLLYINDPPHDVVCNITIFVDEASSLIDQASDLWQQLDLACELESDLQDTVDRGKKWLMISMLEKLNLFCLTGVVNLLLLM